MWKLFQLSIVIAVVFSNIRYEWTPNQTAAGVAAIMAAAVATAIVGELILLPSRFSRLYKRIFGLKDEPADEILRLPRSFRHRDNALENRRRLRIGEDLR